MKTLALSILRSLLPAMLALGLTANIQAAPIADIPLLVGSQSAKPLTMLVAGRDHKLFYEAYNDASDIDGDGTLDIRFKPNITYYGLFESNLCYTYSGSGASGLFSPDSAAGAANKCPGKWSGNFLNYLTTSRVDALRKVLYGGFREVDSSSQTILRRAYIPQDAHSWGKEYKDLATDGYLISDYTPLAQPTASNRRHFFGNLTANRSTNCSTLNNCSNLPPLLRIRRNVGDDARIWQWASKERPVLHDTIATASSQSASFPSGTGSEENFTVRVLVCTAVFNAGCKQYPNGSYKPVGLLHEYGENEAMLFGLMTGSYDKHLSGGRLRKVISSFKDEVDTNSGIFTPNARIVSTFNNLRIRGFNQSSTTSEYLQSGPYNKSAVAPTEGEFIDWGNPVAEMMYEATRYLAGKNSPTSVFSSTTTLDTQVGLSSATWDDPYNSSSAAKAQWCARANFLTISDINTSFDSDSVPGSFFGSFTGDLSGLDVTGLANSITSHESGIAGPRFIGQSGNLFDSAPSVKNVTSLGNIRGLAPEEPNKQGSYYAASVAYFAKTRNLRPAPNQTQIAETFVVALASPLPKIQAKLTTGQIITVVPFAKTIQHGSIINAAKGNYQPTGQIVDYYVETIANSGTTDANSNINGGRYYAKFRINYEDVEQGGDHDMDAIAEYEIAAQADGTLRIRVTPIYQAGSMVQSMGYVISGSTKDGVYLVVQDESSSVRYYLHTPPGRDPGYCDVASPPADCQNLPRIGGNPNFNERIFTGGSSGAELLKDPLWYAAKWGGFTDKNGNNIPDQQIEWDADNDGVPDTYFLVQNPIKLKDSLKRSFDTIIIRSLSSTTASIATNSTRLDTDTLIFQAKFDSSDWSGRLLAYRIEADGSIRDVDGDGNIEEDAIWDTDTTGKIPAHGLRKIYGRVNGANVEFKWSALNSTQRTALGAFGITESILNWVRGDQAQEQPSGQLRKRGRILGDIVYSNPAYSGSIDFGYDDTAYEAFRNSTQTEMLYVGANDGMLHAFDANTGVEKFAFIPSSVLANLASLSNPGYTHRYFVDGSPQIGHADILGSWKTVLVGSTGAGGRSIFALDVTDPNSFDETKILWEFTDPDLGYPIGQFVQPVIARMKNGDWAVIFGNGYQSNNHKAFLFVVDLATGTLIRKIDTKAGTSGSPNGLAGPVLLPDESRSIKYAYAGDLLGNLWKFDLSSANKNSWDVAFKQGSTPRPLFQARYVSGGNQTIQPITAPPEITKHPHGGYLITFGTGRFFEVGDNTVGTVQSLYGIWDKDESSSYITQTDRGSLRKQEILAEPSVNGSNWRVVSKYPLDWATHLGWYIDLISPTSGAQGERVVSVPLARHNRAIFTTLIPSSLNPCDFGGTSWLMEVDMRTGGQTSSAVFDINQDKKFTDDDRIDTNIDADGDGNPEAKSHISGIRSKVGIINSPSVIPAGAVEYKYAGGSTGGIMTILEAGDEGAGRQTWRQLQ